MIHLPTHISAHYAGDAAAWIAAAVASRWQYRMWPAQTRGLAAQTSPGYFIALGVGALIGAWFFGSVNTLRSAAAIPSHSIAGALAGGIAGVELWKWRKGIRHSTGGAFVLPITVGIIIGRFGCLFSGLPDGTFGTPSSLPWAVNLGDGIGRHPVQLYEAGAMALFLAVYLRARLSGRRWASDHAFHAMIIVYAAQRFLWEFLKPYPPIVGPLNIFHLLMTGLCAYGLIWWHRADRGIPIPA